MTESYSLSTARKEITEDLQRRALLVGILGSFAFGLLIVFFAEIDRVGLNARIFGLSLILFSFTVYLFSSRWPRVSLCLLIYGHFIFALLSSYWFGLDFLLCLLTLPVAFATISFGPIHGLLIGLMATIIVFLSVEVSDARDSIARAAILALVWITQMVAWLALDFARTAVGWAWSRHDQMRELLETARFQRVRLKETQEDLASANEELARLTDRLRAMRQLAETARRTKEEFVANVSHELRTPLNMIIGFSEMIAQSPHLYGRDIPPELLADINVIQRNSQHLASLVDDVLDLSQIDAGRMALSREWISLREIVEPAVAAVSPLFQSKGLSLRVDVPGDLSQVFCDRTRIRQVVINLLANAGRFTTQGGAAIRAFTQGRELIVAVSDTGPGISAQAQGRIFEPFEQYHTHIATPYSGSGLGLTISKRFVDMHGGRMWIESEEGKGATFYAALPLNVPSPPVSEDISRWFNPYQTYEPRTRPSRAPKPAPNPRFLILDPGDTLKRLFDRYQRNVDVVVARDFERAREHASTLPAQALIVNDSIAHTDPSRLDTMMGLPYGTPVIRCRLYDRDSAAEQLGVQRYLVKPIDRTTLVSTLDELGSSIRTILVVDDHVEALQLYSRMLSADAGKYTVLRATNGRHALVMLRSRRPDALLLDLVMPGMDGYEVLREKSQDPRIRDIPVVAITARDVITGGVVTDSLTVGRGAGLNAQEFLNCVQALADVLAPPDRPPDRESLETPAG